MIFHGILYFFERTKVAEIQQGLKCSIRQYWLRYATNKVVVGARFVFDLDLQKESL